MPFGRRQAGRGVGGAGRRRRAAHRGRPLPLAAVGRAHDPADGISRRDVSRLCGARSRSSVDVPVIAVGRLGDPGARDRRGRERQGRFRRARPHADRRAANGSRSSRAASRARRCLACNTCVNEMRGGAQLRCVVNGAAGRETRFADAQAAAGRAHRGDRRRARPGSPMRRWSPTATRSRCSSATARPGGAFRYAGKAPLFQEVARQPALVRPLHRATWSRPARTRASTFRYGTDVAQRAGLLAPFDRIVIATGARYRFGLGPLATALLDRGAGHWPGLRALFSMPAFRDWFYYRARRATGEALRARSRGPARRSSSSATPSKPARAGRDRQRIRGGAAASLKRDVP